MTTNPIDEAAARWVARQDRGDLSEADQAALDTWLSQDPRHRGAFVRAEAVWLQMDRTRALGVGRSELPLSGKPLVSWAATSRRGLIGAALAASIAGGVVLQWPQTTTYETHEGEIRRVRLEDGSVAALNGDTALRVRVGRHSRRVKLLRGEAWFEVVSDRSRPFVVDAGEVSVRAVGTAFSIARTTTGAEVSITEGVVAAQTSGGAATEVRLPAGAQATLVAGNIVKAHTVGVQALNRQLAWRVFQIALDGEPLIDAATQFNRYNTRKLVIQDPDLARERLVGWFKIDEPDTFARAVALTLDARVVAAGDEIRITRKKAGVAGLPG